MNSYAAPDRVAMDSFGIPANHVQHEASVIIFQYSSINFQAHSKRSAAPHPTCTVILVLYLVYFEYDLSTSYNVLGEEFDRECCSGIPF